MNKIDDKDLKLIRKEKENKIFYEKLNKIKDIENIYFNYFYKSDAKEFYEFKLQDNIYRLTIEYKLNGIKENLKRSFNVKYSFDFNQEKYTSEFKIIIKNTCKCCSKEEVEVIFPEGEDINHFIIVTELNDIINSN